MILSPRLVDRLPLLAAIDFGDDVVREHLLHMPEATTREALRMAAELCQRLAGRGTGEETRDLLRTALLRILVELLGEAVAEQEVIGDRTVDAAQKIIDTAAFLGSIRDRTSRGRTEETLH